MVKSSRINQGILEIDGKPIFALTADYPYYRDHPDNWPIRLAQIRNLGIETISFYTPWRHHEINGQLDFTGQTHPARDVVGFIRLLGALGLKGILKPGPFIHAELDFGGLPDRFNPDRDPGLE